MAKSTERKTIGKVLSRKEQIKILEKEISDLMVLVDLKSQKLEKLL